MELGVIRLRCLLAKCFASYALVLKLALAHLQMQQKYCIVHQLPAQKIMYSFSLEARCMCKLMSLILEFSDAVYSSTHYVQGNLRI